MVKVLPTSSMQVKVGRHVDGEGRVSVSYLEDWTKKGEVSLSPSRQDERRMDADGTCARGRAARLYRCWRSSLDCLAKTTPSSPSPLEGPDLRSSDLRFHQRSHLVQGRPKADRIKAKVGVLRDLLCRLNTEAEDLRMGGKVDCKGMTRWRVRVLGVKVLGPLLDHLCLLKDQVLQRDMATIHQ